MAASYPGAVVTFTTKHNLTDVVDAADPNNLQNEVVAIEKALGTNPTQSVTPNGASYSGTATNYSTLAARVSNLEHGVVADAHTQYLHKSGGDTIAPAAGTTGLTVQAPSGQTVDTLRVLGAGGATLLQITSSEAVVLKSPTIADLSNAQHSHANAAQGGQLNQANTHGSPDTDSASASLHHTLGTGATQAAAGNHTHTQAQSHNSPDTDSSATSLHHTLGTGASQAAAGNHNHSGVYSPVGHTHTISNITDIGNASVSYATNAGHVYSNNAGYATFNYSGQGGQPSWLWGTNDGVNFYVWNPSNFSVNYASSAGSANSASSANTANSANSAGYVDWGNVGNKPNLVNTVNGQAGSPTLFTRGAIEPLAFTSGVSQAIAHNCGGTPSAILLTALNGGANHYTLCVNSIDSTTFTVRVYDTSANTSPTMNLSVFWCAVI